MSTTPPTAASSVEPDVPAADPARAGLSKPVWVLGMLLAVGALNMVDRIAIGVVQEPMRQELRLSDFQLGLLGGPAFAILYTLISVPLARLADRRPRVTLIAICLAVWSGATALCGLATNFTMLLLCRFGVSVGESGSAPASQSVVVDYFPPERRATVLSVLGLATPIANLLAGLGGGWLTTELGWRATFLFLGLPGLLLALVLHLTVKEPPRRAAVPGTVQQPLSRVFGMLAQRPTILLITLGISTACFAGYAVHQYFISFLMRSHHLSLMQGSVFGAMAYGVFAAAGTFAGGILVDRLQPRAPRVVTWLPAIGLMVASPCYMLGYLSDGLWIMTGLVMMGAFANYLYVGVMFSIVYEVMPARMQNTTVALMMLTFTLLGYGLGPPFLGFVSDTLANARLALEGLSLEACRSGGPAIHPACEAARAHGLGRAIVFILSGYFVAGLCFLAATFTVTADRLRASRERAAHG